MVVGGDGALADELGVEHLGDQDVGPERVLTNERLVLLTNERPVLPMLHVQPRPHPQLCGALPHQPDLVTEPVIMNHLEK